MLGESGKWSLVDYGGKGVMVLGGGCGKDCAVDDGWSICGLIGGKGKQTDRDGVEIWRELELDCYWCRSWD